jgi:hypothetical protein
MEVCCAAGQPVSLDYTPVGSVVHLDGLDVYLVGSGDKAIVAIYDIFGLEFPQASCDVRVVAAAAAAAVALLPGLPPPAATTHCMPSHLHE